MRLTGEVNALNEAIRRLISEGGDGKLLRRYENPNNPRDTSWNDKRKKSCSTTRHSTRLPRRARNPRTQRWG